VPSWARSAWATPITTLIGGFAVDRYGARLILTIAAVLWSLSIGATALATSVTILYAARVLLGVSEGPNFPALTGAVSHWLSPHERATALANALLAVPLALAIGGPLVTQLLGWLDWRLTFAALFVLSAAWIPLWYFCFRDDPSQSRFVNEAELAHIRKTDPGMTAAPHAVLKSWPKRDVLKALLTNRTLLANYWAFFVFGYFLFFFMTWLPSYLEQQVRAEHRVRRLVLGAALAVGRRPAMGDGALVGSSAEDHGPDADRALLPDRRQPVRRRPRRHSGGAHRQPDRRHRGHHGGGGGLDGRQRRLLCGERRHRPPR
jgi:MFS family permease